jgi:hypothetical protein
MLSPFDGGTPIAAMISTDMEANVRCIAFMAFTPSGGSTALI